MGPKPTSGTVHGCPCAPAARHRNSTREASAAVTLDLMSVPVFNAACSSTPGPGGRLEHYAASVNKKLISYVLSAASDMARRTAERGRPGGGRSERLQPPGRARHSAEGAEGGGSLPVRRESQAQTRFPAAIRRRCDPEAEPSRAARCADAPVKDDLRSLLSRAAGRDQVE